MVPRACAAALRRYPMFLVTLDIVAGMAVLWASSMSARDLRSGAAVVTVFFLPSYFGVSLLLSALLALTRFRGASVARISTLAFGLAVLLVPINIVFEIERWSLTGAHMHVRTHDVGQFAIGGAALAVLLTAGILSRRASNKDRYVDLT